MKQTLLLMIAAISLGLGTVGCGSKSSGSTATSATSPTDSGVVGTGWQCEPWQVYNEQLGCLNPGSCPSGYGYNPADGRCYRGTVASEIPQGGWDNGVTVANADLFKQMMRDLNRCGMYNCSTASWAYLSVQISGQTYYGAGTGNGLNNFIPGYNMSSEYYALYGGNYGAPQTRQARINLMTATEYYGGSNNLQFTSSAYPTQTGFQVRVNGNARAYNERIQFDFTYASVDKSQLNVQVIYKGSVVLQGTLSKSY